MGVAGLWDVLRPAAKTRSLTDLAVNEGFLANPNGLRGFRIGIDASIWFFHAEYGREGENPVLRTLFFRCATLMHTTFLPIFVFDGPKRPDIKRGKKINKTSNKLIPGMKQIVEAFGFEWRMAPGEAEAELAYLNRIGIIDGILSDDVDNFLFGATTVIRNPSNNLSGNRANPILNSAGKDDKNHVRIFRLQDITSHPDIQLTRGGLILIGLMSGGDYQQGGLSRCGIVTAHGLAKSGFGDSLYDAATNLDREDLTDFLVAWREDLRHEIKTNSQGNIGRKQPSLAKSIPDTFPDVDILLSYVRPITSESMGRESNNLKLTWEKEPDIAKLAATCEFYFEWGYKEAIVKRFRTVMWPPIVLRILRRAVLDLEAPRPRSRTDAPATPRKKKPGVDGSGTPSKMIASHFSSMNISTPGGVYLSGSEDEDEDEERLILKIHSTRNHTSTDGLLEYRLEVAPGQLVKLAELGIKGTRQPEGPDEWASEEEEDDDGEVKKGKKGKVIDPETHLRLWMPACMVKLVEPRLVEEFEDLQEQKRLKKTKKGRQPATGEKKTTKKNSESARNDDLSLDNNPEPRKRQAKPKPATGQPKISLYEGGTSSDDDLPESVARPLSKQTSKFVAINRREQAVASASVAPSIRSRSGIKDLTKKSTNTSATETHNMKTFFSVAKSSKPSNPHKQREPASPSRTKVPSVCRSSEVDVFSSAPPTSGINVALAGGSSKVPKASNVSVDEDPSGGEYDVALWNQFKNPSVSSMESQDSSSKRKSRMGSTGFSSDSESSRKLSKSPRKKVEHTSPRKSRRPVSPSPIKRANPSKSQYSEDIINITSSDSDDSLPPTITKLPPLLVARARIQARKAASHTSNPQVSSRRRNYDSSDIIDLT